MTNRAAPASGPVGAAERQIHTYRISTGRLRVVRAILGEAATIVPHRGRAFSLLGYPESTQRAVAALSTAGWTPTVPLLHLVRSFILRLQYNAYRRLFERQPHAIAVTWNGLAGSRCVFMAAARDAGVPTLFLERGPLPETVTTDPIGVNFRNGLPRTGAPYRAWLAAHPEADGIWRPLGEKLRQRPAAVRHQQGKRPAPALSEPFVFLALQKQGDTQLRLFGRHCRGVAETVAYVLGAARHLPQGWHLRVKQHPSDHELFPGLLDAAGDLPVYFDNETDTMSQVRASRLVLTVNSSVGLEALLLERPVATMGDAFWALPSIVADAREPEGLARLLAAPESFVADPADRNALLSYLVAEYYPRLVEVDGTPTMPESDRNKVLRRILDDGFFPPDTEGLPDWARASRYPR